MGKRGPPRKPTELKLLQGTPGGKHKLPKNEVKPPAVRGVKPPRHLAPDVRKVWKGLAHRLETLGLLTEIDLHTFERLCIMHARLRVLYQNLVAANWQTFIPIFHDQSEAEKKAGAKPRLKYMQEHPYAVEYRQLSRDILKVEQQFGMTPAARASLGDVGVKIPGMGGGDRDPSDVKGFLYGRFGNRNE